jgi:hypothetical protein
VEELKMLRVRVALRVGPTGIVGTSLWVPRRCAICDAAISTSLMHNLGLRRHAQPTCDQGECVLAHHDRPLVTRCEEQHGDDRANFREENVNWRAGMRGAKKALPWNSALSFYWDCKQCCKVRKPTGRPRLGCGWDADDGAWAPQQPVTQPSIAEASALDASAPPPPPPEKKAFISNGKYDAAGHLAKKKEWFEMPGIKRGSEVYDDAAYKRAYKRAKHKANPEADNSKRRARASYNPDPQARADEQYSRWG